MSKSTKNKVIKLFFKLFIPSVILVWIISYYIFLGFYQNEKDSIHQSISQDLEAVSLEYENLIIDLLIEFEVYYNYLNYKYSRMNYSKDKDNETIALAFSKIYSGVNFLNNNFNNDLGYLVNYDNFLFTINNTELIKFKDVFKEIDTNAISFRLVEGKSETGQDELCIFLFRRLIGEYNKSIDLFMKIDLRVFESKLKNHDFLCSNLFIIDKFGQSIAEIYPKVKTNQYSDYSFIHDKLNNKSDIITEIDSYILNSLSFDNFISRASVDFNDLNDIYFFVLSDKSKLYPSRILYYTISVVPSAIILALFIFLYSYNKIKKQNLRNATHLRERIIRAISSAANDAIVLADSRGMIKFWGDTAQRIFQYTEEEALNHSIHDLMTTEKDKKQADIGMAKFAKTGKGPLLGQLTEMIAKRKDGQEFPIEISVSKVVIDDEYWAIGVVRDITQRKEIDKELHYTSSKLQLITKSDIIGFVITDLNSNIIECNATFARMLDQNVNIIKGEKLESLVSKKHSIEITDIFSDMKKGTISSSSLDLAFKKQDGKIYWTRLSFGLINDTSDENNLVAINVISINQEKIKEREIKKSYKTFVELAESIDDMYISLDEELRIIYWNRTAEKIYNLNRNDVIGKKMFEIFPHLENHNALRYYEEAIKTGKTQQFIFHSEITDRVFSTKIYSDGKACTIISSDITEEDETKKQLEKSVGKFNSLANSISDIFYTVDKEMRFTSLNAMTEALYSVDATHCIGKTIDEVFPDAVSTALYNQIKLCIETRESRTSEHTSPIIDRVLRSIIYPFEDGVAVLARDITHLYNVQRQLVSQKEKFELLANSIPQIFLSVDKDMNVIYWNKTVEEHHNVMAEEILGRNLYEVIPQYKEFRVNELILEVIDTRKSKQEIIKSVINDKIFDTTVFPTGDGVSVIASDITELENHRNFLKESEKKYRELTENLDAIFISVDNELNVEFWNKKAELVSGLQLKDIKGKNFFELLPLFNTKETIERVSKLKNDGISQNFDIKSPYSDKIYNVSIFKNINGFVVIGTDITEQEANKEEIEKLNTELKVYSDQLEKTNESLEIYVTELYKANEQLESLDSAKTYFLGLLAHELNTPLISIKGNISLIRQVSEDPDIVELCDDILRAERKLMDFAEIAQLITRIQMDKFHANYQGSHVFELIESAVEQERDYQNQKNIKLEIQLEDENYLVFVDAGLMSRCLKMILNNAIKFSFDDEKIIIKGNVKKDYYRISIIDYGTGFPPSFLEKIFDMFTSDNLMNHSEGYGLSLTACKLIMDLHGGKISAKNNKDKKGATVSLYIPLNKSQVENS